MNNDKINILVVEDEGIVALGLEDTLQSEGYQVAGMADNGKEALDIVKSKTVDLALLDIQIKGDWDGVETARQLTAIQEIPFIYLTAFSDEETVERARDTTPSAYLVKPYQPRNLLIAIDLALHNFAFRKTYPEKPLAVKPGNASPFQGQKEDMLAFNQSLFIKQNYTFVKINLEDIQYLEASGNHTLIFIPARKYVIRYALNVVLEKLGYSSIIRVHRSFAVNLQHLSTFNATSIFIDDKEIPFSRHYKAAFFRHFDFL